MAIPKSSFCVLFLCLLSFLHGPPSIPHYPLAHAPDQLPSAVVNSRAMTQSGSVKRQCSHCHFRGFRALCILYAVCTLCIQFCGISHFSVTSYWLKMGNATSGVQFGEDVRSWHVHREKENMNKIRKISLRWSASCTKPMQAYVRGRAVGERHPQR